MISKGVRYMLIAGIFFSMMNIGVKYLGRIPAIEIVFFRCIVTLVISFIMIRKQKLSFLGNNKPVLFLRGLFGVIALSMYFTSLQNMPFASAVTIQQLSPVITTIFAIFILKESVRPIQWLFFLLAFIGVAFIKGFDQRVDFLYFTLAMGAAVFSALAYNMVRKLKDTDHPLVVVFYFPLVALPFVSVYTVFHWITPIGWEWIILLGIGISTQLAQVYMTKALQSEKLGTVSIVRYMTVIYALFFGFFLFGEVYNWLTIIGIAFVLGGIVLNLAFKRKYM